ncbi:MAG: T9SS type A sorting domain-containing protein [Ignavibacteriaceae bacterium]|nr:T9SS type A sorting domain-containing protein [Ignavibacteriaceae bacterium]NNL21114.1 T9SS type A sorting domain-containing protein [Ignavibacteriaceae bacterium]
MKKLIAFLFICSLTNSFSQITVSQQFSELKGMEDQQGNTHLLYRIYYVEVIGAGIYEDNSIYHLDISSNSDSLYILETISRGVSNDALLVFDYDHWNKNADLFIWCGGRFTEIFPNPLLQIRRFDGYANFHWTTPGAARKIQISNNDDSLLYIGLRNYSDHSSIKSTDGGWNWDMFSDEYSFQTLFPEQDQVLFATNWADRLFKSVDEGLSYYEVDTVAAFPEPEFIFDQNSLHIYRVSSDHRYNQYVLRVSDNKGEPFSWETKYSSDSEIFVSNDGSISGLIYLADKKNILVSSDYGDNFNLYKSFERDLVGIYKKPSSNKLYAATKYNMYEITPDSVQIIKSLPIPNDVLNIYPLPIDFELSQNYPNPFNPNTTIKYQVPELSFVTIKVYDILGTEVATLVNEQKPARSYEVEFDGSGFPSGIYFYQLQAGDFIETKKMVLLK